LFTRVEWTGLVTNVADHPARNFSHVPIVVLVLSGSISLMKVNVFLRSQATDDMTLVKVF